MKRLLTIAVLTLFASTAQAGHTAGEWWKFCADSAGYPCPIDPTTDPHGPLAEITDLGDFVVGDKIIIRGDFNRPDGVNGGDGCGVQSWFYYDHTALKMNNVGGASFPAPDGIQFNDVGDPGRCPDSPEPDDGTNGSACSTLLTAYGVGMTAPVCRSCSFYSLGAPGGPGAPLGGSMNENVNPERFEFLGEFEILSHLGVQEIRIGNIRKLQPGGSFGDCNTPDEQLVDGPANRVFTFNVLAPPDMDADGVTDAEDNCLLVHNPRQIDTDFGSCTSGESVYGNACDADVTSQANPGVGDNVVGGPDYSALLVAMGSTPADPNWNADADFAGHVDGGPDGVVGGPDFSALLVQFNGPPGPSQVVCP